MFKLKINFDRHGPRPLSNIWLLHDPHCFSFPPTFKEYKWKVSFPGWFVRLVVSLHETFILPPLLWSAQYKICFSSAYTIFIHVPHRGATWAGSRAGPPLSLNLWPLSFPAQCLHTDGEEGGGGWSQVRRGGRERSFRLILIKFSMVGLKQNCSLFVLRKFRFLWKLVVNFLILYSAMYIFRCNCSCMNILLFQHTVYDRYNLLKILFWEQMKVLDASLSFHFLRTKWYENYCKFFLMIICLKVKRPRFLFNTFENCWKL